MSAVRPAIGVALATAALMAASACHVGTRASSYAPAQHAEGAWVAYGPTTAQDTAELLAASDSDIVVVRNGALLRIPYAAVPHLDIAAAGVHLERKAPSAAELERTRLLSRFPQGISPDLERRLVAAYGQDSVRVVHR